MLNGPFAASNQQNDKGFNAEKDNIEEDNRHVESLAKDLNKPFVVLIAQPAPLPLPLSMKSSSFD